MGGELGRNVHMGASNRQSAARKQKKRRCLYVVVHWRIISSVGPRRCRHWPSRHWIGNFCNTYKAIMCKPPGTCFHSTRVQRVLNPEGATWLPCSVSFKKTIKAVIMGMVNHPAAGMS
ncbi:3,4-dihydroxyphenylacetate 2,3-dioxygenase [Geobacillus sp. WSUCF1]|nr:3,4-dihydroxyphenylacetate 2,3-dioxygenase [Geobacillus sp. WSUCF1]